MCVPLRSRKRLPQGSAHHRLPSLLLAIWIPLLESVAANHAHFPTVLTSHIIARLLADANHPPDERARDVATATAAAAAEKTSHDFCLAAWAAWLIEWRRADESDADITMRRQDVFFQLVQALTSQRETSSTSSQQGYVLPNFRDSLPPPKIKRTGKTDRQID